MNMLEKIFERLASVQTLAFASQSLSGSKMDWNCTGEGETEVVRAGNLLTFRDRFRLDTGRVCRDEKQWRLFSDGLEFFHYRNQVFERIFTFRECGGGIEAEQPYACMPDDYFGELFSDGTSVTLTIKIVGTRKNEVIRYVYR
ncbi:hypothetical protein [Neisseria chenwenguii]|nr:hypothetical protein [Neisseria chenwenguii]